MTKNPSSVDWLIDKIENGELRNISWDKVKQTARSMREMEIIHFANWCRMHDTSHPNEVWMMHDLWNKYNKEQSMEWGNHNKR